MKRVGKIWLLAIAIEVVKDVDGLRDKSCTFRSQALVCS